MGTHPQFPESKKTPSPDYLPELSLLSGNSLGVEWTSCILLFRVDFESFFIIMDIRV
jgi:hypothetical protein